MIDIWSFTLTLFIIRSEQLLWLLLSDLYQYEKCVRWINDNPSSMSTAGDGVVLFMYNVSLSLYLNLSDRINSTSSVFCSIDFVKWF